LRALFEGDLNIGIDNNFTLGLIAPKAVIPSNIPIQSRAVVS
jgi:hypothetical protein